MPREMLRVLLSQGMSQEISWGVSRGLFRERRLSMPRGMLQDTPLFVTKVYCHKGQSYHQLPLTFYPNI